MTTAICLVLTCLIAAAIVDAGLEVAGKSESARALVFLAASVSGLIVGWAVVAGIASLFGRDGMIA